MQQPPVNHYATLGLDRGCSPEQIRAAYRLMAKQLHPDINPNSPDALKVTQAINAAHETLGDPVRRSAYDRELAAAEKATRSRVPKAGHNLSEDVQLRIEEFFRGATLEVRVNDPANPDGPEVYPLVVPPETAPGTRFRLPRTGVFEGGFVSVRVRPAPSFRFKARGSDLRCDLRITSQRASQGGSETIPGPNGGTVRVTVPRGVAQGEIIRIPNEGLPKPRGGRGDLLVRVTYRPEVRVTRRRP